MRQDLDNVANELDKIADNLKLFAKILRGEDKDMTGRGAWKVWCDSLSRAMDCKIITNEQYASFKRLCDEDFERRGGKKSY